MLTPLCPIFLASFEFFPIFFQNVRQVLREFRQLCAERSARHECRDELAHSAYAYDGNYTVPRL